jgi:hypothetical protein
MPYVVFNANTPYIASVIYRPVSHPDTRIYGHPSNIGGWGLSVDSSIDIDNQWKMHRIDRNHGSTVGDNRFYHMHTPSAILGQTIVVDITNSQIEQKSNVTPFVNGTRSSTQGLLPVIGNSTIDLTNVSFDSNAQMTFDGTDDYLEITSNLGTLSQYTIEHVSFKGAENRMPISFRSGPIFYQFGDNSWYYTHGGVGGEYYYPKTKTINGWGHWVIVYNGSFVRIYRNGVYEGQQATSGTANWTGGMRIGNYGYGSYPWLGQIAIAKMYNRALSDNEVRQNYQQYKTRFNLS